jgi:hypothetical protein
LEAEAWQLPTLRVILKLLILPGHRASRKLLAYVRIRPWRLFRVIGWLFLGKARFKQELGRAVRLQPDSLPTAAAGCAGLEAVRPA